MFLDRDGVINHLMTEKDLEVIHRNVDLSGKKIVVFLGVDVI